MRQRIEVVIRRGVADGGDGLVPGVGRAADHPNFGTATGTLTDGVERVPSVLDRRHHLCQRPEARPSRIVARSHLNDVSVCRWFVGRFLHGARNTVIQLDQCSFLDVRFDVLGVRPDEG
jgi:hypothetical protein